MPIHHILLVEDSEPLRKVLAEKLREAELDVVEAASGEEGLKVALEKKPDLVLTDLVMYPMDGVEMTTRIRQSGDWGSNVKIVALTNQNKTEEEERRITAAGFDAYLVKAETGLDEVVKDVKSILGGEWKE
jgi:CheY-like chemotaxis protein